MVKVAVVGQVDGNFQAVVDKLNNLQVKQQFAFAILTGDVFSSRAPEQNEKTIDALISGQIEVNVPIYFSVGPSSLSGLPAKLAGHLEEHDGEACPNVFFLGRKGTMTTADGIRIAVLGGAYDNGSAGPDQYGATYTSKEAAQLAKPSPQTAGSGARDEPGIDILLTSEWPTNITNGSKKATAVAELADDKKPKTSDQIGFVTSRLKPRYHFSSSPDVFFEREPIAFPNTDQDGPRFRLCRFISLARFGNERKQKWIYAFNMDAANSAAAKAASTSIPTDATASPLAVQLSDRRRDERNNSQSTDGTAYSRFGSQSSSTFGSRNHKRRKGPAGHATQAECFFCLANPTVATHLITTIGEDAYMTTAKGPLPTTTTFGDHGLGSGFGCHMLIIPLAHSDTLASIQDRQTRDKTVDEMERFRKAVNDMVADRTDGKLGTVTWEVSRPGGVHAHWQIMPVPTDSLKTGLVQAAFSVEAENRKYPSFQVVDSKPTHDDVDDSDRCFFRARLWSPSVEGGDAGGEVTMTLEIPPDSRFDLQFGRHVLAQLLLLDDRKQWKDCVQSEDDETAETEAFKAAFEKFDFTS